MYIRCTRGPLPAESELSTALPSSTRIPANAVPILIGGFRTEPCARALPPGAPPASYTTVRAWSAHEPPDGQTDQGRGGRHNDRDTLIKRSVSADPPASDGVQRCILLRNSRTLASGGVQESHGRPLRRVSLWVSKRRGAKRGSEVSASVCTVCGQRAQPAGGGTGLGAGFSETAYGRCETGRISKSSADSLAVVFLCLIEGMAVAVACIRTPARLQDVVGP